MMIHECINFSISNVDIVKVNSEGIVPKMTI